MRLVVAGQGRRPWMADAPDSFDLEPDEPEDDIELVDGALPIDDLVDL